MNKKYEQLLSFNRRGRARVECKTHHISYIISVLIKLLRKACILDLLSIDKTNTSFLSPIHEARRYKFNHYNFRLVTYSREISNSREFNRCTVELSQTRYIFWSSYVSVTGRNNIVERKPNGSTGSLSDIMWMPPWITEGEIHRTRNCISWIAGRNFITVHHYETRITCMIDVSYHCFLYVESTVPAEEGIRSRTKSEFNYQGEAEERHQF